MQIILDTNFLIYCAKEKLDYVEKINELINEDYDLVVPNQVINELKKVSEKKKPKNSQFLIMKNPKFKKTTGKDKDSALLALQLLKHNKIKEIDIEGENVDKAIINFTKMDPKNVVCTLDKEMRTILGRVILISRGKKLILTK